MIFKAVPGTGTVVWIRIRIDFGRPDPDPGGQKYLEMLNVHF
jgi:hypothetical protein